MKFGLTTKQINELKKIFTYHAAISEVIIFGSRALEKYNNSSDIDFAIKGNINFDLLAKIKHELEETTSLPYFFDVIDYNNLKTQELKTSIDQEGKIFYQRKKP